jgi:hypothetical protein
MVSIGRRLCRAMVFIVENENRAAQRRNPNSPPHYFTMSPLFIPRPRRSLSAKLTVSPLTISP